MCIYTHDRNLICVHAPKLCNLDFILIYIYIRKTQQMYKSIYIYKYVYSKQPNPNSKLYSLYIHEICEYIYTYIAIYWDTQFLWTCTSVMMIVSTALIYISYSKLILPFAFALPWSYICDFFVPRAYGQPYSKRSFQLEGSILASIAIITQAMWGWWWWEGDMWMWRRDDAFKGSSSKK